MSPGVEGNARPTRESPLSQLTRIPSALCSNRKLSLISSARIGVPATNSWSSAAFAANDAKTMIVDANINVEILIMLRAPEKLAKLVH
jgi:hypothetical protein